MKKNSTREKILDEAEDLLQSRGYSAFSYADISERLGIRKPSIHHHFPRKADLALALVKRYRQRGGVGEVTSTAGQLNAADKMNLFIDSYLTILQQGDKICPIGMLEADYNNLPASVQAEVRKMVKDLLGWLEQTLEEGRAGGEFKREGQVEDQALMIMASLQGGLQIARTLGHDRFYGIRQQIRSTIMV